MYGKPCHFLVELDHKEYWAINQCNMDIDAAGKQRKLQLNELEEIRMMLMKAHKFTRTRLRIFVIR